MLKSVKPTHPTPLNDSIDSLDAQNFCPYIDELNLSATMQIYNRGEILASDTGETDYVCELQSGIAATILNNSDHKSSITNLHSSGSIISSKFLNFQSTNSALQSNIIAMNSVCVKKYPADTFFSTIKLSNILANYLLEHQSKLLNTLRHNAYRLGKLPAKKALIDFIYELLILQSSDMGDHRVVLIPLNRVQIADYLGLTVETVSRKFSELKESKLISYDNAFVITITDTLAFDVMIEEIRGHKKS